MAQADKSVVYNALKERGVTFDRHYREYTTEELLAAYQKFVDIGEAEPLDIGREPELPGPDDRRLEEENALLREQLARMDQTLQKLAAAQNPAPAAPNPYTKQAPKNINGLDPSQHAGITLNAVADDEVLEVDQFGNQWYQVEVTKPGYARPRGRRVLRYDDPGVVQESIKVGEYIETFEVAGDPRNARPSEVKITLPSYQTGIYRAPNMPFKIHTYNGVRGFDLDDVQAFYGGGDLVPETVKRCYVSTDLCYDIQSTIRTIENEYRERVLNVKGL